MSKRVPAPRILQYTYGGSQLSGIDSYLLETIRALPEHAVDFDLLFRYEVPYDAEQVEELRRLGCRLSSLDVPEHAHPLLRQLQEARRLWKYLSQHRGSIIEVNMTSTFMCLQAATLAKLFGYRTRIVHAHDAASSEPRPKRWLKALGTPLLNVLTTHRWACAPEAARYLFGRRIARSGDWRLVKNSIDTARFAFDPAARADVRAELDVEDAFAIGMVGRLTPQKNHTRALADFAAVLPQLPHAKLLIVGDGPLRAELESQAQRLGIAAHVRFLGSRADIPRIMSALDTIVAPSVHEGFPIVALEAQASGVPLLVSRAFPPSCVIDTRLVRFSGLADSAASWAQQLRELEVLRIDRVPAASAVAAAGYDRTSAAHSLARAYSELALTTHTEGTAC